MILHPFHSRSFSSALLITLLLSGALCYSSVAQDNSFSAKFKSIDSAFVAYAGNDSPGAAVAIYQDGEVVYKNGYGMANLEYDIPIRPNTIFHVASISKQFTSFAILLLEKEGKLSNDDDIRKYLPEIHDFGPTITIRHLMSHTSGFRDQWSLLLISGWRMDDVITKEQIFSLLQGQRELNFNPGDEHFYSNSGYSLMARIVERVSGMDFDEYAMENIFKPLGMTNTHVHDDHTMIVPNRAYSYRSTAEGYEKAVLNFANDGATSLFTTVEDLSKWMDNMFTYELGGEELIKKLSDPYQLNSGKYISYGLGQTNSIVRGHKAVGHGGSDAGFRTMIEWYPEEHSGFVVFFNTGSVDFEVLTRIRSALLEEKETHTPDEHPPFVELGKGDYEKLEGSWVMNQNTVFTTNATDTALVLTTPFGTYGLQAHDPQNYSSNVDGDRIYFGFEEMDYMTVTLPDVKWRVFREGNPELTPEELKRYTGRYYSEETQTYYTVEVQEGKLIMEHKRTGSTELKSHGNDIFTSPKWGLDFIRFQRKGNKVNGFLLGNGRVRDLRFVKE